MSKQTPDQFHSDPANWKMGIFYFCREDPRIVVPKRILGLGWTLNFGRPTAIPFLAAVLGAVWGILALSRNFVPNSDIRFGIKLFLAAGVIALCYRLSHSRTKDS